MRGGLHRTLKVLQIANACGIDDPDMVVGDLYRAASWFSEHGKQGKMQFQLGLLDGHLKRPGFAAALVAVGWAEEHEGVSILKGFCAVSASRKALSKAARARVLSSGSCAACGATSDLVIDHIIPIAKGGSCAESNLQALCATCNRAKGKKSMQEFMRDR